MNTVFIPTSIQMCRTRVGAKRRNIALANRALPRAIHCFSMATGNRLRTCMTEWSCGSITRLISCHLLVVSWRRRLSVPFPLTRTTDNRPFVMKDTRFAKIVLFINALVAVDVTAVGRLSTRVSLASVIGSHAYRRTTACALLF